jgi:uncharacterized protein (DUF924 family)
LYDAPEEIPMSSRHSPLGDTSSASAATGWADDVLRFWFHELQPNDRFTGTAELDELIRSSFGDLHRALQASPLLPSSLDARALLAAVIVFDQFSRNLFRKSASAYATDARALELARHAVATGKDRSLQQQERYFLYMPFMHSEDRAMQAESVRLFSELGSADGLRWAHHHQGIVERFGRFPHRNAVFGRASTPEELEFLKTEPSFG